MVLTGKSSPSRGETKDEATRASAKQIPHTKTAAYDVVHNALSRKIDIKS